MLRYLRFGIAGVVCAGAWLWGFLRFVGGQVVIGGAVILVSGMAIAVLVGLWHRDKDRVGEGVLNVILEFFANL